MKAPAQPMSGEELPAEAAWIRNIAVAAGKGNLPRNIDARGVVRAIDKMSEALTQSIAREAVLVAERDKWKAEAARLYQMYCDPEFD